MWQRFDERNRDIVVNINGRLVHRDQAAISPFDSSVQNGDAVWEGLRLYKGRIFRLQQHLDRLYASASALAYTDIPSGKTIITELRRTLIANEMHDGVHIRLTLTRGIKYTSGLDPRLNDRGPTLIVLAEFKAPVYQKKGLWLIIAQTRRIPRMCLDQRIHSANQLNSILAKIESNRAGADDAIMMDIDGNLAETNATHVFVVRNATVMTPDTRACPEGVTRSAVFQLCKQNGIDYEICVISKQQLLAADEVFCTGTMGEIVAVTRIDETQIGNGEAGPVTQHIAALYAQLTAAQGYDILNSD